MPPSCEGGYGGLFEEVFLLYLYDYCFDVFTLFLQGVDDCVFPCVAVDCSVGACEGHSESRKNDILFTFGEFSSTLSHASLLDCMRFMIFFLARDAQRYIIRFDDDVKSFMRGTGCPRVDPLLPNALWAVRYQRMVSLVHSVFLDVTVPGDTRLGCL